MTGSALLSLQSDIIILWNNVQEENLKLFWNLKPPRRNGCTITSGYSMKITGSFVTFARWQRQKNSFGGNKFIFYLNCPFDKKFSHCSGIKELDYV